MWRSTILILAVVTAASGQQANVPAASTTRPAFDRYVLSEIKRLQAMQVGGRYRLSDLVDLRIENGLLKATLREAGRQFKVHTRVGLEGLGDQWLAASYRFVNDSTGEVSYSLTLTGYDFDQATADGMWRVYLSAGTHTTPYLGATVGIEPRLGPRLQFSGNKMFFGICPNRGTRPVSFSGATLGEVRAQCPDGVSGLWAHSARSCRVAPRATDPAAA